MSAIYAIVNIITGERYIGSTKNLQTRVRSHRNALARGTHKNHAMQAAWNECGPAFYVQVLEQVEGTDQLAIREQFYMDALRPEYNLLTTASRYQGKPLSGDRRAIMSAVALTPESRERLARNAREMWTRPGYREHVRERISAVKKGVPQTPDHPKRVHGRETRRRILQTLSDWAEGSEGRISAERVARHLGLGETTVHRHFRALRADGVICNYNRPLDASKVATA